MLTVAGFERGLPVRPLLAIASTGCKRASRQCDLPDQPGSMEGTCCREGTAMQRLDERSARLKCAISGAQLVGVIWITSDEGGRSILCSN